MADYREKIPGWLDAVKNEAALHETAFSHPLDTIAGLEVRHMSLLDMCQLLGMGCSLVGKMPSEEVFLSSPELRRSAAVMVTFLRSDFRSNRRLVNRLRIRRTLKLPPLLLYDEIKGYNERTFMDRLGSSGRPDPISRWSTAVEYIDLLASEYGWGKDAIMRMPYRQLIQLCRRIMKRLDSKTIIPSLSDNAIANHTRQLNQKRNEQL